MVTKTGTNGAHDYPSLPLQLFTAGPTERVPGLQCLSGPGMVHGSWSSAELPWTVSAFNLQALVTRPLMTLGKLYPDLLQQLVLLLRDDDRMQTISHTLQNKLSS